MTVAHDEIVIFGTGEIAQIFRACLEHDTNKRVVAFTVDDAFATSKTFDGLPLLPWSSVVTDFPASKFGMHVALSYQRLNQLREEKYHQAREAGYTLISYVSPRAVVGREVKIGDNCFIQELNNLQYQVKVGNNVMLWAGNHIGHGTIICDHVYMASHICISGHCIIGERTFIGVNAATRDFANIGSDTFVAMGANITSKEIAAGSVVLAPSSTVISADDRKAKAIKKGYFGVT